MVKHVEPALAKIADPFPSPPFPDPDNEILRLIITHAVGAYQAGEVDVAGPSPTPRYTVGPRGTFKARTPSWLQLSW